MGIGMGKLIKIEERGRILIPKNLREELKLKAGRKMLIEKRDEEIIIKPVVDLKKLSELRGCIKKSKIKPLEIKKIWKSNDLNRF
jgi:AbrB family looped-hinge helix DNA binding protein